MPPVSTTLVKQVAKFAAGVVDTGGKKKRGMTNADAQVEDEVFEVSAPARGRGLPPVSLIPAAILPPVSLTPVVNLKLRISPRIFEKIRNGPNGILRGLGKTE